MLSGKHCPVFLLSSILFHFDNNPMRKSKIMWELRARNSQITGHGSGVLLILYWTTVTPFLSAQDKRTTPHPLTHKDT